MFDFIVDGIDGFIRHKTKWHTALLAHYGFVSVFPLLAVMTTILGYTLENEPKFRNDIVNSVFARLPFIGEQIRSDPTKLHGNAVVLIFGLTTSLWAGTRAFIAAQNGLNDSWEIPEDQRPNFFQLRKKAVLGIAVVGIAQIASATVTSIVGISGVSWLNRVLLVIAAIAINIGVLLAAYNVLTARELTLGQMLPGAIVAGLGFSVLQLVGTIVVQRAIRTATPVYGSFATVIALLTWLSLHGMIALFGAEANAALDRRHVLGETG